MNSTSRDSTAKVRIKDGATVNRFVLPWLYKQYKLLGGIRRVLLRPEELHPDENIFFNTDVKWLAGQRQQFVELQYTRYESKVSFRSCIIL